MIGGPLLVLGLFLVLSAVAGPGIAGRRRGAVASFILSPVHPASWHATGAIILGAAVEGIAFSIVASIFSAGVSLLVVVVGIGVIGLGIEICRFVARIERARMRLADPRPLPPHPYRATGSNPREWVAAVFMDMNRWRDVVYVFVAFPLTILEASIVVALWLASLALLTLPLWPGSSELPIRVGWPAASTPVLGAAAVIAGLILAQVAASMARGLSVLHRAVVAGLLCESEQRALEHRVETLVESRKNVLDVEASELRRIERDLHDGAQQRLVMLAMDLGMAAERLDADPTAARALVLDAQDQARLALAELRDLVRGIAPPILMDRGLVAAIGALTVRSPVPTTVTSTLTEGERLPDAVERAAYYVVAEALTNVAKHAAATRCDIVIRRDGDDPGDNPERARRDGSLVIEVRDDGAGGARPAPGGGLAGLAGRVEGLDGRLDIASSDGGGTTMTATIPLGGPAGRP